ncbi:uncharacterized protein LOC134696984 [Mytilus trossulus]|uniref:uncharacterized protein LOC134696984 n=1 Tax=Mytilus trossulus TaxID=6551 RepID=UPI0030074FD5
MMKLLCTDMLPILICNPGFITGFKRHSTAFDGMSIKNENSKGLIIQGLSYDSETGKRTNHFKGTSYSTRTFKNFIKNRPIRAAGDQPAEGKCQVFKWGGTSGTHWYSCCNNCNIPGNTPSCDGNTYQSASSNSYCSKCGEDNGISKASKYKNEFKCGDCDGQDTNRKKCLQGLRMIYNIPGLCWAHILCFKKFCEQSYSRRKRDLNTIPDTCFNLKCEVGETTSNCPVDCCSKKNPSCTWKKDTCLAQCCGEPTCCLSSTGNVLKLNTYMNFGIGLFLIIFLVL